MALTPIRDGVRRIFRLALRRPDIVDKHMDDELQSYLDERTDYLVARGMAPDEARDHALHQLGDTFTETRNRLHHSAARRERHMQMHELLDDLMHDVRYAARGLLRRPGFTAIAVITLAIGIGANTAIFSAIDALLLRPLPFKEPDRLVKVSITAPSLHGMPARDDIVWSYPKFGAFREAQTVFEDVAIYMGGEFNVTGGNAERVTGEYVSVRYLPMLGVSPEIGANFPLDEDGHPSARPLALIGDALWKRRFNADSNVVGRVIDIGGAPYAIVGVMGREFHGLSGRAELFIPVTTQEGWQLDQPWNHSYTAVGRLKRGVTLEQAQSAVVRLGQLVDKTYPARGSSGVWGATSRPLDTTRVAPIVRRSLLVLFGAVGFVLLIACVNLANLLLGRASARSREIAIRLAIGAGRGRLIRLLLAESVLLSLLGGAASVIVAWWGARALSGMNPANTLRAGPWANDMGAVGFSSIRLDPAALLFTLGVALGVGVLFGLVPAIQATSPSLTDALKEGGARALGLGGVRGVTSRRALVVVEVALALVLLAGSGLMIQSLTKLLSVNPGFDAEHVLTFRLTATGGVVRDSMPGFHRELMRQLGTLPGVTDVGITDCPPLNGGCAGAVLYFPDLPPVAQGSEPPVGFHVVTPSWFKTMHVPLLRGRMFTDADRAGTPKVLVINAAAANEFWPNQDPVGKRAGVSMNGFDKDCTIIGVVGDVRFKTMDAPAEPDTYVSSLQLPNANMVFLRTVGDPLAVGPAARRTLHTLAPDYPVYDMQTMESRVAAATSQTRFSAVLLALFAGVALALAVIGIYGVVAFGVAQRTHEIGLRMALGADRARVVREVLGEGIGLTAVGVVIGVGAALVLTRVLRTLLFEVTASDPMTYVAIVIGLGVAAAIASWVPARRAARVDPVEALRSE